MVINLGKGTRLVSAWRGTLQLETVGRVAVWWSCPLQSWLPFSLSLGTQQAPPGSASATRNSSVTCEVPVPHPHLPKSLTFLDIDTSFPFYEGVLQDDNCAMELLNSSPSLWRSEVRVGGPLFSLPVPFIPQLMPLPQRVTDLMRSTGVASSEISAYFRVGYF